MSLDTVPRAALPAAGMISPDVNDEKLRLEFHQATAAAVRVKTGARLLSPPSPAHRDALEKRR